MAGGSERTTLSAAEFERVKLSYLETITQELQEAAGLMERLGRNLHAWGQRAGQAEALAQVWSHFQARLVMADLVGRSLVPPGNPPLPGAPH